MRPMPGLFIFGRLFAYSTPRATEPPQVQRGDNASVQAWSTVPLATTVNAGVLPYNSVGMVGYPRAAPEGDFAHTMGIWVSPLPTSF
jgi:hypothetical protein